MAIIKKCQDCRQFNTPAYNESDLICSRCKMASDKGITQLPDRTKNTPTSPGENNSNAADNDEKGED